MNKKSSKTKKHDCEKYRYTAEKYNLVTDGYTGHQKLGDERFLISWCSFCGKRLRIVRAAETYSK